MGCVETEKQLKPMKAYEGKKKLNFTMKIKGTKREEEGYLLIWARAPSKKMMEVS